MNVTPYLIGFVGIALLLQREIEFGVMMLIIAVAEILMPNLNANDSNLSGITRFGLAVTIVFLIVYRLSSIRT
ncbi:hypothetical protein IFO70_22930 [Phormidium tenue FACHB-886]|nr:hypothetical protein [Phormidium tenue FACHB-886]